MTATLPPPPVPAEVDLRGLPYMPLDVHRLRDSDLAIEASDAEFKSAVLLWCASWAQVPAASVPDNDKILANLAGYGSDLRAWRKVKAGAMAGFYRCNDGRFYHDVIAEKAIEAWEGRKHWLDKKESEDDRLRRFREEHRAMRDELRGYGVILAWNEKIDIVRATLQAERLKRNSNAPETVAGALPATANKGEVREREAKGEQREGITLEAKASATTAEPSGSDGKPSGEGLPVDPIWGAGLALLVRKGLAETQARRLLGKALKALGDVELIRVLAEAEANGTPDPGGFVMGAVAAKQKGGAKPLPRDDRSDDELAAANLAALEEMRALDEARA